MIYKPDNFILQEWLPKEFYEKNSYKGETLWLIFDFRILWTAQQLRNIYGKANMNDWYRGGHNQYRGWRPFDCSIGAELSQHKFARAGDMDFVNESAEQIREDIKVDKYPDAFKYITCIEDGVGWLHSDCRNWDKTNNGLLIVNP